MHELKSEQLEKVTLLLRKGDMAQLRELAAARGLLIPRGPGTGGGSVSHLIRAILDDRAYELGLHFAMETSANADEQMRWLKLAMEKLQPLVEQIKRKTDALAKVYDVQSNSVRSAEAMTEAAESVEALE